jgi:hypothetical protein
MMMLRSTQTVGAALAAMVMLAGGSALAGPGDYQFALAGPPVKAAETTLIRLRLVHVPDGKPVSGAILIQPQLEMGEGPSTMSAPVKPATSPGPGLYALEAWPDMGGEWVLSVGAKVPGETGTVRGRITLNLAQ